MAPEAGVDVGGTVGRGFGVAWGDYDNDGRFDMLYTREADSRLFHNEGPNGNGVWTFTDVTGVGNLDIAGNIFQCGNFADLNNDGWLDILLANVSGNNMVFMNQGDDTWHEVAGLLGMQEGQYQSQGVVPADIDNDGDLDVVWYNHDLGEPNSLFRNENSMNNWIQFRLTGIVSNRDAVGARIEITTDTGPTQIREVVAGTGFFADIPRIQTFGLGQATTVTDVTVTWPNGIIQPLGSMAMNQRHDVTEPAAAQQSLQTIAGPSIGHIQANSDIPETTILQQNYPNPFNPNTTIRYGLSKDTRVTLKVYNIMGREVITLVKDFQTAGYKSVEWNGHNATGAAVSGGIYIFRMEAGDFVQTQKMIFSK